MRISGQQTTISAWIHTFDVMRNKLMTSMLGLTFAVTLAACDGGGGDLSSSEATPTNQVSVFDNSFDPAVVAIAAGDTVTWTWEGNTPHDVDGESFKSEVQTQGTFEHTFDEPGEYRYVCNIHSGMNGVVVVTE